MGKKVSVAIGFCLVVAVVSLNVAELVLGFQKFGIAMLFTRASIGQWFMISPVLALGGIAADFSFVLFAAYYRRNY